MKIPNGEKGTLVRWSNVMSRLERNPASAWSFST